MHDYVLININFLWNEGGKCRLDFRNRDSEPCYIEATGVIDLSIPYKESWGASSSVLKVNIHELNNDMTKLEIEMQSGDVITINASNIKMPD